MSDDVAALKEVGQGIAAALKDAGLAGKTLILASSDMTHYEPEESAREKDKQAIDAILALDEDALVERIRRYHISMCGYAPAIVMIAAAKALGATKAELTDYQTSAAASGDTSSVVGYAGIIVY